MKLIKSKWWIGILIILFIVINLLITNLNEANKEENPTPNRNVIIEGNLDTH